MRKRRMAVVWILVAAVGGAAFGAWLNELRNLPEVAPHTVAAPAVEPLDPAPVVPSEPDPDAAATPTPIPTRGPLTFHCPAGDVVLPFEERWGWDRIVAEHPVCAHQLLDYITSHGGPEPHIYHPVQEAVCDAVWRFCPERWRR